MIPRVFHYYWSGELPQKYADLLQRNRDVHKDWHFEVWHDGNLPSLRNQYRFDRAASYVKTENVAAFKATIVRYELLSVYGGVWSDYDVLWLKPIDDLLDGVQAFTAYARDDVVNNAIIGAESRFPFIETQNDVIGWMHQGQRSGTSGWIWHTAMQHAMGPRPTIFPREYFYGLNRHGELKVKPEEAYALHLWGSLQDVDLTAILDDIQVKG